MDWRHYLCSNQYVDHTALDFCLLTVEFQATDLPASNSWGVDLVIRYGDARQPVLPAPSNAGAPSGPQLQTASGILDSGNAQIAIAAVAFDVYIKYTGATEQANGFYMLTAAQYKALESLWFRIGEVCYFLISCCAM